MRQIFQLPGGKVIDIDKTRTMVRNGFCPTHGFVSKWHEHWTDPDGKDDKEVKRVAKSAWMDGLKEKAQ